ncbi:MAG: hypothetical protein ABI947_26575 [Chloroflexota bacterium]
MLVRTDILLAQQVVQVGHACLEAGRQFEWSEGACNLVVLGAATLPDLQIIIEQASLAGIRMARFYEPDGDLGLTAVCTEPLTGPIRRVFRRLTLWREPLGNTSARDPPTGRE